MRGRLTLISNSLACSVLAVLACGCGGKAAAPGEPKPPALPATQPAEVAAVPAEAAVVDRLPNGLTVIVKPLRRAPVVCVRGYVRAGGLYEGPFLGCGISHLTEHLAAQGAEHDGGQRPASQPSGRSAQRIMDIGGQANAYTSLDHTCYHVSAAAGKTAECIDLVADWLARPDFTEADFMRERGVVQREQEMGKDDPDRQLHYQHMANLYGTHPAAVPIIGYESPLAGLTFQEIQEYHRRMYVPQNMILCVVGDLDAQAVLQQVRKALGDVPQGRTPDLALPGVQPLEGIRRVTTSHPALNETLEEIGFQTIPLLHEDLYALDVLSYVLSQGPSSRLPREIYRKRKLVTAVDTGSWTPPWGLGSFAISFRSPVEKADEAEAAILAELRKVAEEGVVADELDRAKRQKVADLVHERQTVESQAAMLATDCLSTGNASFSADYTLRIQAVTAMQVQAVARKYFTFDRIAVTRMTPAAARPQAASRPARQPQSTATAFTMPNGLRAVLQPVPSFDGPGLVSAAFVTKGGLLLEDEQSNGMGSLMAALSTRGAGDRTAEQIAAFFDRAGGGIRGECGNNTFYWQATVLEDGFAEALEILADVVRRPRFNPKELEILRPVALAAIQQVEEDWQSQLNKFFRSRFFAGSPYRMLPSGRAEVVKAATVEQLTAYHRRCIRAGSSVLTIYGSFDPAAARKMVQRLFASVPPGQVDLDVSAGPQTAGGGVQMLKTTNKVAGIIVAVPGMKIGDLDDRLAVDVLDTIISGYQYPSGWLHQELRGKQLVYVVHAYNWAGLAPGAFVTYAGCQPQRARQVIDIINRNYERAATYLPSQKEVDQAASAILTAETLDNQSIPSLALSAALDELYGFGFDFRRQMEARYRAVKPADVRRVARKYLGQAPMVAVTTPLGCLGPPATQPATSTTTDSKPTRTTQARP
jgi:zinc protease